MFFGGMCALFPVLQKTLSMQLLGQEKNMSPVFFSQIALIKVLYVSARSRLYYCHIYFTLIHSEIISLLISTLEVSVSVQGQQ